MFSPNYENLTVQMIYPDNTNWAKDAGDIS
jgi:hypothetical protein